MDALGTEEMVEIVDIFFHDFVNVGQVTHWFACLVDNETGTPFIRKVFNALGRHYFDELHMAVAFGDVGQVKIDKCTELVAVLIEMKQNNRLGVCFSDFSHILIPGYFYNLAIFALGGSFFDFFHAIGHVLFGELVIKVYLKRMLPRSSSSSSSCSSFILFNLFYNLFSS